MTKKVIVKGHSVLLDGFFRVEEAEISFELKNGGMSAPVRRTNLKRDLAAAVLINNKACGTVVLVRQFRYSSLENDGGWVIEVVAGLIDPGETADEAIRREAVEEAGYEIAKLETITTFYTTPGICSERIALFYGETRGDKPIARGGGLAAEGEDIEVVEVPYAEAFAMIERGEIVDGKSLIALLWFKDKLRGAA